MSLKLKNKRPQISNKESLKQENNQQGETAANAQGNRENNLYQALMQNELQGKGLYIDFTVKLITQN